MTRTTDTSTYDDDFFAWTQEQAAALRRLPRDTIGPAVDIEHVAEEIEDLGKRDLREVRSFLTRLVEHLIEIVVCPGSIDISIGDPRFRIFIIRRRMRTRRVCDNSSTCDAFGAAA